MVESRYNPHYSNQELDEINCLVQYYCVMRAHYKNRLIRAGISPTHEDIMEMAILRETRKTINRKLLWSRLYD